MARYQSKISLFLADLKSKHPEIEKAQLEGRALLWDKKPISLDEQKQQRMARIKQKSYVYSND
jgi:hypothetical protein